MTELKPCPFCGSPNIPVHFDKTDEGLNVIYCPDCGLAVLGGWYAMEKEELARRWNRRVKE